MGEHIRNYRHYRILKTQTNFCPNCGSMLASCKSYIPFDSSERVLTVNDGRSCDICQVIFVSELNAIHLARMYEDKSCAKDYQIDGWPLPTCIRHIISNKNRENRILEQQEKRRKREEEREEDLRLLGVRAIPFSTVLIIRLACQQQNLCYAIVENPKYAKGRILWYQDALAREFLAAVFVDSKQKVALWNGYKYEIIKATKIRTKSMLSIEERTNITVCVNANGGLSSSITDSNKSIVDLLMFSPFSQRYEIVKATYDDTDGECCVAISLFKEFVKKYGNPGITRFSFGRGTNNQEFQGVELKEESILKQFGYSVSRKDGKSTHNRQAILADIVDLQILEAPRIVKLLNFFISSHSDSKYEEARAKWEEDRKFISTYSTDPNRFLIASYSMPK